MLKYPKLYGDEKIIQRKKDVFLDNHKYMALRNQKSRLRGKSLRLGVNQ